MLQPWEALMFIQNKYTKLYYSIIQHAKARETIGYTETHHIIPRSLGGQDTAKNLVSLTPREHYICHALLPTTVWKSCKGSQASPAPNGKVYQMKSHKGYTFCYKG